MGRGRRIFLSSLIVLVHLVSPLVPSSIHVCDPLRSRYPAPAASQSQPRSWHLACMRLALEQAEAALKMAEVPVGCVIVAPPSEGEQGSRAKIQILASGHNMVNTWRDATAHAELVAIRSLPQSATNTTLLDGNRLRECHVFVTCEPCIMCSAALKMMGATRVTYGCRNPIFGGCGSVMSLHNETCLSAISGKQNKELVLDSGGLVWEGGLLEPESASLMRQFYSNINLRAPREKQQRKLRKFQQAAGLTDKVECGGAVVDLDVDVAEIPAVHAINALRGGQGEQETRASHEMDKGDAAEYDWTFTGVEGEEDELLVMATKMGKMFSRLEEEEGTDEFSSIDDNSPSNDPGTLLKYARALMRKDEYKPAELLFRRTLLIKPQQSDALVEYGNLLQFKRQKASHADRMYRMSLANDPTYAPAVYNVALSDQVNFNRLEEAEAAYQQVLDLDPGHIPAMIRYAALVEDLHGDSDKAEDLFRAALDIDFWDVEALSSYSYFLYHTRGRKEACNSYLAIAQRLDPSNERFRAVFKSLDVLNKPWLREFQGMTGDESSASPQPRLNITQLEEENHILQRLDDDVSLEDSELEERLSQAKPAEWYPREGEAVDARLGAVEEAEKSVAED